MYRGIIPWLYQIHSLTYFFQATHWRQSGDSCLVCSQDKADIYAWKNLLYMVHDELQDAQHTNIAMANTTNEQETECHCNMGLLHSVMTKPLHSIFHVFSPVKLVWEALVSFIDYITQPWRNLFWLCFNIYLTLWSGIGSLSMKMLVLPIRIYNAMQKENMIQMEIQEIQKLYMDSEQRVSELEGELEQVLDECKQYKELLDDAETQKKTILKKYQLLQCRVLELEDENDHLKAHKERVSKGVHEGEREFFQQKQVGISFLLDGHKVGIEHNQPSDKYAKDLTGKLPAHNVGRCLASKRPRYEGRGAALSSSLFSVFLSLLVGAIAWQAQDPCIPLVVAVFMVVCMSLKTVAQFLLSVYNGPGFDALALLSFNWFILGTLAYPVLPRIAQTVAPIGMKFGQWLLR